MDPARTRCLVGRVKLEGTLAPPKIPDYELIRLIGKGSYGDVWLAQGLTGLYRAIKIVWRHRFSEPEPFDREFRGLREFAAISIRQSQQLALLHIGRNDEEGFFFYVMELADDITGAPVDPHTYIPHTLKRRSRLPASQVIAIGVDLARALSGLHERGLVHRDIKPSNVIFVGGVPKLADVGLVSAASSAATFVGTEGFVPPEGPGTPAADVFSLGKLLYEIATGLDRCDYPRLPADLHHLSDRKDLLELNEILIRACAPRAGDRYCDATALLDDLLLLQGGRSMRRLRAAERRLAQAVRVGIGLALLAGVASIGAWVERTRAEKANALRHEAEAARDDLMRKTVYSVGLTKAQRALDTGNLRTARRELNALVPSSGALDLRGFEWQVLMNETRGDPVTVLRKEGSAGESARFSPDGRWLAVSTTDERVTLWDCQNWSVVRTIDGVRNADFSPDGQWLVGIDSHSALLCWAVATGLPGNRPLIRMDRTRVGGLPASADVITSTSQAPHVLRVWDLASGQEIRRLEIPSEREGARWDPFVAALSADHNFAAIMIWRDHPTFGRALEIYDLRTGKKIIEKKGMPYVVEFALSSDGAMLVQTTHDSGTVKLYDIVTQTELWEIHIGTNTVSALCFSPDGKRVAVGDLDHYVWLIETATGKVLNKLLAHDSQINDIAWEPNQSSLISISASGEVFRWQDFTEPPRYTFQTATKTAIGYSAPSPDGRHLLIRRGSQLDLISADNFEVRASLTGRYFVDFSPDGKEVTILTRTDVLQHWNIEGPPHLVAESKDFSGYLAFRITRSRDRSWLATTKLGRLVVWDSVTSQVRFEREAHPTNLGILKISPDGESIFTTNSQEARVWDSRSGALLTDVPLQSHPYSSVFDPHGRWVALGFPNGVVEIRHWPGLKLIRAWNVGTGAVTALETSPQGNRLLSGSASGTLHVFSTDDWREIMTLSAMDRLQSGNHMLHNLAFSANGRLLVAHFANGQVRVWRQ